MNFEPLDGPFGKVVHHLNVASASDAELVQLLETLYQNRFLVIRTPGIDPADYVSFARRLGEPIRLSGDEVFPEIAKITNQNTDTLRSKKGAAHWHTDQSFRQTVSSITMLYSVIAPKMGGETQFCDMVAAYDALSSDDKSLIENLTVEHRHGVSVSAPAEDHKPIPPPGWDKQSTAFHPLVRKHPETQVKTLYAPTGTAQGICQMSKEKGTELLKRLTAHALQPQFLSRYKHQVNDILLWDNPTVMHRATPIAQANSEDTTRLLLRISLKGKPPVLACKAKLG